MSTFNTSNLLTPPKETDEIYPYRRVWRSLITETSILGGLTGLVAIVYAFTSIRLPENLTIVINVIFSILPALLWLVFSRWREDFVQAPRRRLLSVFVVSALTANAVAIPITNLIIQPDLWLLDQDLTTRIIGYTTTVGILGEFLKYLVLRYLVWPGYYRTRLDAVAYGIASAVGYATMINLIYALQHSDTSSDLMFIRILNTLAMHIIGSSIVSYGLAETAFRKITPIFLPITCILASLITGISIPVRSLLINASLGVTISAVRPLFGYVFVVALIVAGITLLIFVFNVAQKRDNDPLLSGDA